MLDVLNAALATLASLDLSVLLDTAKLLAYPRTGGWN